MSATFNSDNIDTVVFHYPCMDGLSSAWVVCHYYKLKFPEKTLRLFPAQHGKVLNYDMTNQNVLFVDFCPQLDDLELLKSNSNNVYILDHHITAKERLENCPFAKFDMNKSGVGLTWEYFFSEPIPEFLDMIQQRDLWTLKFQTSDYIKEFCQGLFTTMDMYETIEEKLLKFNDIYINHNAIVDIGRVINTTKQIQIKQIVNRIKDVKYTFYDNDQSYSVCMYNCNADLASDLGNALSKEHCDFAVLWRYDHVTETYNYSLRSTDKANCADICYRYLQGGGHKNAAGGKHKDHPCILFNNS